MHQNSQIFTDLTSKNG